MYLDILTNENIALLIEREGMRGLGTYLTVIVEIHRRPSRSISRNTLFHTKLQGATQRTLARVLDCYGLFNSDGRGHLTSAIPFTDFKNEEENENTTLSTSLQTSLQSDCTSTPARTYKTIDKKTIDNDCRRYGDGDGDNGGHLKDIIARMRQWGEWSEAVAMKSGFSRLLRQYWQEAVTWFEAHVTERDRRHQMTSLSEARRYFSDIINNTAAAGALQRHLEAVAQARRQTTPLRPCDCTDLPDGPARWDGTRWVPLTSPDTPPDQATQAP